MNPKTPYQKMRENRYKTAARERALKTLQDRARSFFKRDEQVPVALLHTKTDRRLA